MVKLCANCGGEFDSRRSNQRYCSSGCRRAAQNRIYRFRRALGVLVGGCSCLDTYFGVLPDNVAGGDFESGAGLFASMPD